MLRSLSRTTLRPNAAALRTKWCRPTSPDPSSTLPFTLPKIRRNAPSTAGENYENSPGGEPVTASVAGPYTTHPHRRRPTFGRQPHPIHRTPHVKESNMLQREVLLSTPAPRGLQGQNPPSRN